MLRNTRLISTIIVVLALLALVRCGRDSPTKPQAPAPARIAVTPQSQSQSPVGQTSTPDYVDVASSSVEIDSSLTERAVLIALYNATNGPNWTNNENWLSEAPLGDWYGVTNNTEGQVTQVVLDKNNLQGTIPSKIGQLNMLENLSLENNQLSGTLPIELGQLKTLTRLALASNQFTGSITTGIGELTNLRVLGLQNNQFTGSIPHVLGQLSNLTWLSLDGNQLSGAIPVAFGRLSNLRSLSLVGNQLSGAIPADLGQLSNLTWLSLGGNQLSGAIPVAFGRLNNLRTLSLGGNQLSGAIPADLGRLSNLTRLSMGGNQLSGAIPAAFGRLSNLQSLYLGSNQLSGAIPAELGQLSNLTYLNLSYNSGLSGTLPLNFTTLTSLEYLYVAGTGICAPANPEIVAWLSNIEEHNVVSCADLESDRAVLVTLYNATNGPNWINKENWLSDAPLGEWYGVNTEGRVVSLWLSNNNLSGTIPDELGKLIKLRQMGLQNNPSLSGTLPLTFTTLTSLEYLYVAGTGICAPANPEIQVWLSTIEQHDVSTNCADIDTGILTAFYNSTGGSDWTNKDNWLSDAPLNDWYGVSTDETGRVKSLVLPGNNLRGAVPPEVADLANLRGLNLSLNDGLIGPLPLRLAALKLESLDFDGTHVCATRDAGFQAWLVSISDRTIAECVELDTDALVALVGLYTSTGGKNWINNENWLSQAPLVAWYGVTTDGNGRVTELDLSDNNLNGSLPSSLSKLADLVKINLSGNAGLLGPLPESLTGLSIESLDLSGTEMCAPSRSGYSTWINGISDISGVDVCSDDHPDWEALVTFFNDTNGPNWRENTNWLSNEPIDVWHGVRTDASGRVTSLHLGWNNLLGSLPPALGNLDRLENLALNGNELSGPIPKELGGLGYLQNLDFGYNMLSGTIPEGLFELSNLKYLRLTRNQFLTGPIPADIGNLTKLEYIDFYDNAFSGSIPSELGQLKNLKELILSRNQLSGEIPGELGHLAGLSILSLAGNSRLSGQLPNILTNLNLEALHLGGTQLCAPLDEGIRTWLSGIADRQVADCIPDIESTAILMQTIQSFTNPVPIIAGEDALLRVFMVNKSQDMLTTPRVRAEFYNFGTLIYEIDLQGHSATVSENIEEGNLQSSANAVIPGSVIAPGLEYRVQVDRAGTNSPIPRRIPNVGRIAADIREVSSFDLTLVPFIWTEDPDLSVLAEIDDLTPEDDIFRLTRDLLPIQEFNAMAREPIWTTTEPVFNNRSPMLRDVSLVRTMDGAGGFYMGVLNSSGGAAYKPGFVSVSGLYGATVAHELGHNLSLSHAPCGFPGSIDPHYPFADGTIGSWGYDFESNTLVDPSTTDVMSYCGNPDWISGYSFLKALDYRQREEEHQQFAQPEMAGSLLIWGGLDEYGNLFLDPSFAVDAAASVNRIGGPYRISGMSEEGGNLFTLSLQMNEIACAEGAHFVIILPVESDWPGRLARITLTGPEGTTSIDSDGDRRIALMLDQNTGAVRGIFRNWLETWDTSLTGRRLTPEPGMEIIVSDGIPGRDSW